MKRKNFFSMALRRNDIQAKFIKLGLFLNLKSNYLSYFLTIIIGFVSGLSVFLFVKGANLYSGGVSGLAQGIARIIYVQTNNKVLFDILFWTLYGMINIPLIFFAYFYIAKKFTIITVIFLLSSLFLGLILDLTIPEEAYFRHIFGDPQKIIINADNRLNYAAGKFHISMFGWFLPNENINSGFSSSDNTTAILLSFVYGFFNLIFTGFYWAVLYMMGGSSAGTDILSFYFADKYKKPVGSILMIASNLSMFLGYLLGSYIPFGLKSHDWNVQWLISPILIISMLTAFMSTKFYISIFPKDKLIEIKVITEHADKILDKLSFIGYNHGFTIYNATGGHTKRDKKIIITVLRYYEILKILNTIKKADESSFVQLSHVLSVLGNYAYQTTKEIEKDYYNNNDEQKQKNKKSNNK